MRERAVAGAFLLGSGLYLWGALSFPLGTAARPGPGFFPVAVGVFLCLVAGAFLLTTLRRRPVGIPPSPLPSPAPRREREAGSRARVAATATGLAGFCLLLPWTGYPLAAFLFVALLLRQLGGTRWPAVLVAAAVSAAASYYVFAVLLAVPLPRGALFD